MKLYKLAISIKPFKGVMDFCSDLMMDLTYSFWLWYYEQEGIVKKTKPFYISSYIISYAALCSLNSAALEAQHLTL